MMNGLVDFDLATRAVRCGAAPGSRDDRPCEFSILAIVIFDYSPMPNRDDGPAPPTP